MLKATLLSVLIFYHIVCVCSTSCKLYTNKGIIDLTPIAYKKFRFKHILDHNKQPFDYELLLCSTFTCDNRAASLCQIWLESNNEYYISMGEYAGLNYNADSSVTVIFKDGSPMGTNKIPRITDLTIYCDANAELELTDVHYKADTEFIAYAKSKYACEYVDDDTFGIIVITGFLLLLSGYIGGGITYAKCIRKVPSEIHPHQDYIKDFFALVKEGAVFIAHKTCYKLHCNGK